MSAELAPAFRQQFFDSNGLPLAGGFVYTYAAGTTTPLATYTDETGLTPNTNPVVLDSSGQAPIWIGNSSYKFVLEDSLNNVIETVDNIESIASQIIAISSSFLNVTVSYAQLQTAALNNAIALFTVPAGYMLKNVVIKHSTAFAGTGITDVYAQVGPSGNYTEFINQFDIYQSVADQSFDNSTTDYIGSWANPTVIYLNAVSVGANLSALSSGSVTVYYEIENMV
jgi:hypothetical protein